jgi:hypothetical protein
MCAGVRPIVAAVEPLERGFENSSGFGTGSLSIFDAFEFNACIRDNPQGHYCGHSHCEKFRSNMAMTFGIHATRYDYPVNQSRAAIL